MKSLSFLFLFIFMQISPLVYAANEREFQCKVIGISDGDTLTCLKDRAPIKVRLKHIDAPESSQPYGNRAKQALANFVFKKQVTLRTNGYDKYQRLLAVVYEGGQNINLALVQRGMAWAYRETQPIYEQAQQQARQQNLGLWQDKNPLNPAEWRRIKGTGYSSNHSSASTPSFPQMGSYDCSQKLSCAYFKTFEEANRYFRQCGSKTMDGNGDGIPCNSLYRKMKRRHE